jgi:hypothetical protein
MTPAAANGCDYVSGVEVRQCGQTEGVRRYLPGRRCPEHTPAALAGRPEAPEPGRPWWIREDGSHLPLPPLPAVPKSPTRGRGVA